MQPLRSLDHSILEKGMMEFPPFGINSQGHLIRDVSGVTVLANIRYLEEAYEALHGPGSGPEGTETLCTLLNERLKDPSYHVSRSFLLNTWNSYSYEFVCFLGEFCRLLTNDHAFPYKVGERYFISPLIRNLGRPFSISQIYSMFSHFGKKFAQGSIHFEAVHVADRSAILRMKFTDEVYLQFGSWRKRCADLICQSSRAGLAAVPKLVHHLEPARLHDRSCIARGDDYCEWELTWTQPQNYSTHTKVGISSLLAGSVGWFGLTWGPWSISPDLSAVVSLLLAGLAGMTVQLLHLHQSVTKREHLVQEQLHAVESRHEELREAYLHQEQATVTLKQTIAQLQVLHQTGLLLSTHHDTETIFHHFLTTAIHNLQYDRALLSIFDQERGIVSGVRLYGVSPQIEEFARSISFQVTDPDSLEGLVLLQKKPVLVSDIKTYWPKLHPLNQKLAQLTQSDSLIAVPLRVSHRVFGSLTVDRTSGRTLTQNDLDLMTTLGNQMAVALDNVAAYRKIEMLNVRLEATVQERTNELARANKELEAANHKLQEKDQLKSSFISIASHELRTPMTSIQGYVQNMLDGLTGDLNEKQYRYLSRIGRNSARLTRMINDLLDLSRIETGAVTLHIGPVGLAELSHEVLEGLTLYAEERQICMKILPSPADVYVQGDRDKIHRILTNLVHNALTFTQPGGRIFIQWRVCSTQLVHVTVEDTGEGIQENDRQRIFETFYRGSSSQGGSQGAGLGLAITKTLVDLHGGTINVESWPGKGSRFTFTLPFYDPASRHFNSSSVGADF